MLNTGPATALVLSARAEAPRPRGAAGRLPSDAPAPEAKRRGGPADRRASAAARQPGGAEAPGASARFLAHSFAQARWPRPDPRLTQAQAVAHYPSLTLFAQVIAPDDAIGAVPPPGGHLVDLSV